MNNANNSFTSISVRVSVVVYPSLVFNLLTEGAGLTGGSSEIWNLYKTERSRLIYFSYFARLTQSVVYFWAKIELLAAQ